MTKGPETVRIGVSRFGDLHIHSRGEPLEGFPDQPEYIRADIHAAEVARLREAQTEAEIELLRKAAKRVYTKLLERERARNQYTGDAQAGRDVILFMVKAKLSPSVPALSGDHDKPAL